MAYNNNDPFGRYDEKNVGRTVQNVTSSMWEPISTGSSVKKDTPVRKNSGQAQKNVSKSTKSTPTPKKSQNRKSAGVDVTKDRISEGGRKTVKTSSEKKSPKTSAGEKKKKTPPKDKREVGGKNREPKGRDTRNIDSRKKQAKLDKEKKKARDRARSIEKQSRQGVSYDEMRKKTSRAKRLKAKIIAIATVVISLVAVACCVGVYAYSKGAPVAVINVEGESRYKSKKIIETANVYVGINMLSVREKTVNDTVTKSLPYIKEVQVDYQFPETLALNVTPTQEKLLIVNSEGYICVDEDDKVLSLKKKKLTDGRYLVEGLKKQKAVAGEKFIPTENNAAKYEKAKEIAALLQNCGKFPKGTIDVTDLKDVSVIYDSRVKIYLGDCSRLESQLEFAMTVIEKDEDIINGQTGYIETRYEGQATFKPGSMKK